MTDELKHECAVAMVVLRKAAIAASDYGGTKLSLLLEKQHNRGQDGAGAAILRARPVPGEEPYWMAKSASATSLADILGAIAKRPEAAEKESFERIFLGHLRYATFGKNDTAFCHPFAHESSDLAHTLLLAGNFNLTNAHGLFDDYARHGSFPTSKADGYLISELIAHALKAAPCSERNLSAALSKALARADGAWTLCGATGDGWAFATRDPHGIRPGFYYIDERVVVVASERPAIQAAFDVPPEAVKELPPGQALLVSPDGEIRFSNLDAAHITDDEPTKQSNNSNNPNNQTIQTPPSPLYTPCSFERIYFSRANDADIHRERKALGAALLPKILEAAQADLADIYFSYIPNSARIAFHGLLEALISNTLNQSLNLSPNQSNNSTIPLPRFGEVIVKDAKFRTFIADAAARREFYKHVYDVTYGLVKKDDTLVVLDDSIVRGNTMKNAILPMLDRLGPKRIVIASSAPPIRYPDCYGIDMSTLGELVAFKALVNLLGGEPGTGNGKRVLNDALAGWTLRADRPPLNPLASLYARFTEEQHCAEIARLLTPPGMKAEVKVVYQSVEDLRRCLSPAQPFNPSTSQTRIGDWYFTGDYPTPGGYKVLDTALRHFMENSTERSY